MGSRLNDTSPEAEAVLIEGFRRMTPQEKLERVLDLNAALDELAEAGILDRHGPDIPERELRLRKAALRLPRETMIRVFGWDPEAEGY